MWLMKRFRSEVEVFVQLFLVDGSIETSIDESDIQIKESGMASRFVEFINMY